METFSSNPSIKLFEEGKWLLAVTSFEASNSVFNVTDENNSFSNTTPAHWSSEIVEEIINQLKNYQSVDLKTITNYMLKKFKKGTRIVMENSGFNLAGFDQFKGQKLARL